MTKDRPRSIHPWVCVCVGSVTPSDNIAHTRRNVNDSGFFSIEVLRQACARFGDLQLLR